MIRDTAAHPGIGVASRLVSDPIAILDVQYSESDARAACVVAARWTDPEPIEERITVVSPVNPYRPGAFYERELPCLVQVLSLVETPFRAIVIDGYVELDAGAPGLGAHVHTHFGGAHPVIGVAKTAFRGSGFATPVLRGMSHRPLYVTARGLPVEEAAARVAEMHGEHRIPTLLGWADRLARGILTPR